MTRRQKLTTVLIAALMVVGVVACTSSSSNEVTVCRNGGMFDNNRIRTVLDPGEGPDNVGLNTHCYSFPVSTRIYDASGSDDADRGPLTCTTSDAVAIRMSVAVRFTLNTDDADDHAQIKESFNEVLDRYDAHTDEGWDRMLDATIGRELDSQVESICRDYTGRVLATQSSALSTVQSALRDNMRNRINENVGTKLFCGPGVPYGDEACPELTVSVTRIVADSEATREAFEAEVREEANTRAATQQVQTAEAQAESIRAQAAAAAEAGDNYVNLQLIRLCEDHPDACPTLWVLPSGAGNLTIPTPAP